MNLKQITDRDLISAYKASGDSALVGELYPRYFSHLVYIICSGWIRNEEDRKDAVMEIFEKLLTALKEKEVSDLKNWLAVVTRNHCITRLRKQNYRARFTHKVDDFEKFSEHVEFADDARLHNKADAENQAEQLQAALQALNAAQRSCIEMFDSDTNKKSYKEIAGITGYSEKEVKSHIQNGRRKLKILLMKQRE